MPFFKGMPNKIGILVHAKTLIEMFNMNNQEYNKDYNRYTLHAWITKNIINICNMNNNNDIRMHSVYILRIKVFDRRGNIIHLIFT